MLAKLPVQRLKRSTLFVDVLSVKEFPKRLLLRELPPEVDILCTHPMFGPDSGEGTPGGGGRAGASACDGRTPDGLQARATLGPVHSEDSGWAAVSQRAPSAFSGDGGARLKCLAQCFARGGQTGLATWLPACAGKGAWTGLNMQYERVRISPEPERQRRADAFLQASRGLRVQGFHAARCAHAATRQNSARP